MIVLIIEEFLSPGECSEIIEAETIGAHSLSPEVCADSIALTLLYVPHSLKQTVESVTTCRTVLPWRAPKPQSRNYRPQSRNCILNLKAETIGALSRRISLAG